MRKNRIFIISAVILLLFVVSACGKGTSDEGEESGKKEFKYAMSGVFKPFSFKENGKITGFDMEIGEALADKMDMEPVPVTNPFETIIPGLQAKKYDAVIGSLTITPERQKAVDFTDPYYKSGSQIFVLEKNNGIKSSSDLKGKKIGVVKASVYLDHAKEWTDEANIIEYDSDLTALQDLPTGRLDAVITDQMVGFRVIKEGAIDIKDVGEPLSRDEQAIAVRKEDDEMLEKVNKALQEIVDDGTYERISDKWFGRNILQD